MPKDRKMPTGGQGAAKSTVGGPRRSPRSANGDRAVSRLQKTQALAAAFPFNSNKPGETGRASRKPRAGTTVEPPDPTVLASTLTEAHGSLKTGAQAQAGVNPGNGPLDRVRVNRTCSSVSVPGTTIGPTSANGTRTSSA